MTLRVMEDSSLIGQAQETLETLFRKTAARVSCRISHPGSGRQGRVPPQAEVAFPYLAITSPTKRCGKTRLGELLELVSAQARASVGISVAALFRIIQKEKPTLIVDEAESVGSRTEKADALREILNAGYKRDAKVVRCKPQSFDPEEFNVYCPKALILIGKLPDTLSDRCIPIRMQRRRNEKLVSRAE